MKKQTTSSPDENYWGIFAVSDRWWCDKKKAGGLCNVKCDDLLSDIEKNAKCGRQVYRQDGSGAWKLTKDCLKSEDENIADCIAVFGTNHLGQIGERINL